MMKYKPTLVAAIVAALAMTGLGAAHAGTASGPYGTLTAADASAFANQCVNESQHLTAAAPDNANVTITGPGGVSEYGSFDAGGTGTVELCSDTDPAGAYYEHVALYDADYNYLGALDTTFTFTRKVPELAIKRTRMTFHHERGWKVAGTLTVQGTPWTHQLVHIQARIDGLWLSLGKKAKRRTTAEGKLAFFITPAPNHYKFRLYVASTVSTPSVHSKAFRLPHR